MITVTRLNGEEIVINAGFIEFIEQTPDTTISLTTGHRIMARESVEEIIERVIAYESRIGFLGRCGRRQRDVAHYEPPTEEEEE